MSTEAVSIARSRTRSGAATAAVRRLWRQWRRRSSDRRQMAQFANRELRDLGITQSEVERELARPFWRHPFP
jgi:uncharacterized protein YjiS (DUF1127 family)